jgi:recyclin-1
MSTYKPADHAVDESVAPLVQFFELVHIGDTIAQMVQVYYDREMVRRVECVLSRDRG